MKRQNVITQLPLHAPISPLHYGYCNIGRRSVHRIQDGPKSAKEVDEVETAFPTVTEGLPIILKDSALLVQERVQRLYPWV